jgi:hypothetical protein
VTEVRALCRTHARDAIGDLAIGDLLAKRPHGGDGTWPCEPVRQVLEETASNDIARGMEIGVYNSRGVTWRGPGGDQERELAAKYRKWSGDLALEFPFVSQFLEKLARGYDQDAVWHDTEASIRRRLRN